jgi:hypothetical protein
LKSFGDRLTLTGEDDIARGVVIMHEARSGTTTVVGGLTRVTGVALVLAAAALVGGAGPAEAAPGSPCAPDVRVCVQLSRSQAWLLAPDGVVVRGPVPITAGAPGMETPAGRFSVQWKDADHVSPFGDTPMPWSVFFDRRGRALHGGSLQRESRGCIHLADDDARAFFEALSPGQGIQILS